MFAGLVLDLQELSPDHRGRSGDLSGPMSHGDSAETTEEDPGDFISFMQSDLPESQGVVEVPEVLPPSQPSTLTTLSMRASTLVDPHQ